MKRTSFIIPWLLFVLSAKTQTLFSNEDSTRWQIARAKDDTTKVLLYANLSFKYAFLQVDTAIYYAQKAISLARQIQYNKGLAAGLCTYGWALWAAGEYDKAVEAGLKSLNLYKDLKDDSWITFLYAELEVFYRDAGDYEQALKYGRLAMNLYDSLPGTHELNENLPVLQLGTVYLFRNQLDSASFYITKAYEIEGGDALSDHGGYVLNMMGYLEAKKKRYDRALTYYQYALANATKYKNNFDVANSYGFLAQFYQETGKLDSSIWYAKQILGSAGLSFFRRGTLDALAILAKDYKLTGKTDSALKYLEAHIALNDSLFNKDKARAIQNLSFNEELQQQELEAARIQYRNQVKLYAVFGFAGVLLLIGIILYRNNKVKQKANTQLQQQKEKLESTLKTLESTQSQLIQSEKMASLGELTAGIAHEIQNPLNFVNNFSEVNTELIDELQSELKSGNSEAAFSLSNDIKENEQKINQHGKRADSIVKGMLQHSRSGTSVKESTDLNALADEYLRLSYQGLRAKDKYFNAAIQTDYDQLIGHINIIPQDIGRVLLNLLNNAFYAVSEKKKSNSDGYEPALTLTTKKLDNKVEIRVRDNGNGIPRSFLDKIFQPFFTTKPTGQGTGLGLSMSYDIVKAHGGEIKVSSKEGEFTEFMILLPYD